MPAWIRHVAIGSIGLGFGFALSRIGFSDWGEVHRMFVFEDLRLTLTFGGAVAILTPLSWAVSRRFPRLSERRLHRGVVPGGILFGAGWALTGACPSIAMVQLGEGQLLAALTLAGIVLGVALSRFVQARFLRWDADTCDW
jgi:uncharacterized protein